MSEKGMLQKAFDNQPDPGMAFVMGAATDIAKQITDAEHRADELQQEIDHDARTGLLSERKWNQELDDAIESLEPSDVLTVFIIDLDGFKKVNDGLGHSAGNELLDIAGSAISQAFRREGEVITHGSREQPADSRIARLGGDEYAIFSVTKPDTNPEHQQRQTNPAETATIQATRTNDFLADAMSGTKFEEFPVTVSMGAAQYDTELDSSEHPGVDVFVRADAEMYAMKYQGKIKQITPEDKEKLEKIIPYLESKGARVESWLKDAVYGTSDL